MRLCFALLMVLSADVAFGVDEVPNILFVISDDQSFPHAGAYGCEWVKTPAFDRVARQGLLFTNAYTPNAKCAPSRSVIVTGRNSWQLGEAGNHVCNFPDRFKSFCEVLRDKTDYVVGYTGKGVDPVFVSKGRQLTGRAWQRVRLKENIPGVSPLDYASNFEQFMDDKPAGRPFCFWYGAKEPHRGYRFGIGIEKGGKSIDQIDKVPAYWPDNETVRTDMLDYAYEIEHFDRHLGRIIALLEERGELENTLIIVTSDNGMPFPRGKGIQYEISNHMPLAMMWPKGIAKPGRTITDYVSFIDFAPTILEVAGVDDPQAQGMVPMQGESLSPIFRSEKNGRVLDQRDHVLLGQERHDVGRPDDVGYPVRSIIREGMLYIHNFEPDRWPMCNPETGYLNTDASPTKTLILNLRRSGDNKTYWRLCFGKRGSEELYDLKEDPDCLVNLIDKVDRQDLIADLKQQLFSALKEQQDPRMLGKGHLFDDYPYARKHHRDFYNRYMAGKDVARANWVVPSDFEKRPLTQKEQ